MLEQIVIETPPTTPSDALDACLSGIPVKNSPKGYPYASSVYGIVKHGRMKAQDAERMLWLFIDEFFLETDENESVKAVARTVLDSPENAHDFYTTFKLKKKDGGFRTIEAPDEILKKLQRTILRHWWYARRKPMTCVQGFVPKRGTLTNAAMHVADGVFGKDKVLIKVDIRDFFMSVTRTSIMNRLMNDLGYWCKTGGRRKFPEALVNMFRKHPDKMPEMDVSILKRFSEKGVEYDEYPEHASSLVECQTLLDWIMLRICCLDERLPQGSPCSPALANAFMKDFVTVARKRLLNSLPMNVSWEMTVYADDVVVTLGNVAGDKEISLVKNILVKSIMEHSDISVNYKKIGVFKHGHPQKVTGITITDKLSISRKDRDKVRAELHNALSGKKTLTSMDKLRLRGVRAWMRGVDKVGWDSRCEKDFQEAVGK